MGNPISSEEAHHERMVAEHLGEEYTPYFHLGGPRGKFRLLANQHFADMERELGNEQPEPLLGEIFVTEEQFKK